MHAVVLPLAFVLPTVDPGVDSAAVDVVVRELTDESRLVRLLERPVPMFLAQLVRSFVTRTIGPSLNTGAMLLVLEPLSNVFGPILVVVGALSVRLVIEPLALVNVSVIMN